MKTDFSSVYFRFLNISKSLTESDAFPLNANHRALLETVALAWHEGSPMTVRQAISLEQLGSPATLHKRLAILRSEGYLQDIAVDGDKRTKLLGPTPKALAYFGKLGSTMAMPQI